MSSSFQPHKFVGIGAGELGMSQCQGQGCGEQERSLVHSLKFRPPPPTNVRFSRWRLLLGRLGFPVPQKLSWRGQPRAENPGSYTVTIKPPRLGENFDYDFHKIMNEGDWHGAELINMDDGFEHGE